MHYKCEGPGCNYACTDIGQLDKHHVVPRSHGGSNSNMNLIRLCPNCHRKVYQPEAKKGLHSVQRNDYLILKGIKLSSDGLVMEYEDNTTTGYVLLDTWRNSFADKIKLYGE